VEVLRGGWVALELVGAAVLAAAGWFVLVGSCVAVEVTPHAIVVSMIMAMAMVARFIHPSLGKMNRYYNLPQPDRTAGGD
jgi:hypothetical protein